MQTQNTKNKNEKNNQMLARYEVTRTMPRITQVSL